LARPELSSAGQSGTTVQGSTVQAATLSKSPVPDIGYVGKMAPVETLQGIPLWKPPYGRITAIDLNTGEHRWMAPVGDLAKENSVLRQLGLSSLGRAARGHLLLTKTLLIVGQEGNTQREESVEHASGPQRGVRQGQTSRSTTQNSWPMTRRPARSWGKCRNATGAPMTYMLNGKQFIVVPTGGANLPAELIALSLR
jgi:quinoprotein glucose dehydrogenase